MTAIDLANREEMPDIAFPPAVARKAAVIVLRAHGNFQWLHIQVDVMGTIQVNCERIHMFQTFNRRFPESIGFSEILIRLLI